MKSILVLFFTLSLSLGCNLQKKQNIKSNNEGNHFFDMNNNFHSEKAIFFIQYYSGKVRLEIYINDLLLVRNDTHSVKSQEYLMLNHLLTNDKEQSLKIKFFSQEDFFDTNSSILLQLHRLDSKENWNQRNFDSQKTIIKYDSQDESNLEDKNIFEKEFTFKIDQDLVDASPNIHNLAKDLSSIDADLLKKRLVKKYNQLIQSVEQKDEASFWNIYTGKAKHFAKYNQLNKEELEDLKEEGDFIFNETELILNSDSNLFFYRDNRIISLENTKDRKPALSFKYKAEDDNYYSIEMPLYFYILKDSNELQILY